MDLGIIFNVARFFKFLNILLEFHRYFSMDLDEKQTDLGGWVQKGDC